MTAAMRRSLRVLRRPPACRPWAPHWAPVAQRTRRPPQSRRGARPLPPAARWAHQRAAVAAARPEPAQRPAVCWTAAALAPPGCTTAAPAPLNRRARQLPAAWSGRPRRSRRRARGRGSSSAHGGRSGATWGLTWRVRAVWCGASAVGGWGRTRNAAERHNDCLEAAKQWPSCCAALCWLANGCMPPCCHSLICLLTRAERLHELFVNFASFGASKARCGWLGLFCTAPTALPAVLRCCCAWPLLPANPRGSGCSIVALFAHLPPLQLPGGRSWPCSLHQPGHASIPVLHTCAPFSGPPPTHLHPFCLQAGGAG